MKKETPDMNFDSYTDYQYLVEELDIMSNPSDFAIVSNIAKFHDVKKILEIGGGCAGWSIGVNKVLGNIPDITVIENFEFTNYTNYGGNWPPSEDLLKKRIEEKCINLNCEHNINILNMDAINIPEKLNNEKFDLIRIDCLGSNYDEVEKVMRWAHGALYDNGLLYIDDIEPRSVINRFLFAMDLTREKLIRIVFAGYKEAVFCKWNSKKTTWNNPYSGFMTRDLIARVNQIVPNTIVRRGFKLKCLDNVVHITYWGC